MTWNGQEGRRADVCIGKSRVKNRAGSVKCAGGKAGYRIRRRGMNRKGRWGGR